MQGRCHHRGYNRDGTLGDSLLTSADTLCSIDRLVREAGQYRRKKGCLKYYVQGEDHFDQKILLNNSNIALAIVNDPNTDVRFRT